MKIDYNKLFSETPEPVIAIDGKGQIVDVNHSASLVFGYSRSELIGINISLLMPSPDRELHDGYMNRYLSTNEKRIIGTGRKLVAQRKSGEVFPVFLTVTEQEVNGEPVFLGIVRDLSEYETKLADLTFLGELVNTSLEEIYIVSTESMNILYMNRGAKDNSQYAEKEFTKLSYNDLLGEECKVRFANSLSKLSETHTVKITNNCYHIRKDGTRYPVEFVAQKGMFQNQPVYMIHALDRSEKELLENQISTVLESSTAMVLLLDINGAMTYANKKIKKAYLGKPFSDSLELQSRKIFDECLASCKASKSTQSCEIMYAPDDRDLCFSVSINPVIEVEEVNGYVVIASDITEFKNVQAQLKISSRLAALGELAAGIGHEINNPLAIISGHVNALIKKLASETPDIEACKQTLERVNKATARIQKIVTGFKHFAHIDNKVDERVNVSDVIREVISMVEGVFSNDDIKFEVAPIDPTLFVRGSYGRIQQILMNLFSNARDALIESKTANPEIRVVVEQKLDTISICVQDNGPGVALENEESIFNTFFTTKPPGKGTGLGLPLSFKMAKQMDASLNYVPSRQRGARFDLTLAMVPRKNEKDGTELLPELVDKRFAALKVLIVEDEADIREILFNTLVFLGVTHIDEATHGQEAIDHFSKNAYDVVFTDIKMPGIGGIEVVNQLRELIEAKQPTVAVITGGIDNSLEQEVRESFVAKLDHYLLKPFDEFDIFAILKSHCDNNE